VFHAQRSTRKTCSNACRQRLKRYRATRQCWQSRIREQNLESDLAYAGLSLEEVRSLQPRDFTLEHVPQNYPALNWFIRRNDWLRSTGNQVSHRFTASYRGILAGAVLLGGPGFPSGYLPESGLERTIHRGACISWSPKGLASRLLMFAVRWMVRRTRYRIFTAFSDPEAGEIGTIYQACNFRYLGQRYGSKRRYSIQGKESNDRYFRTVVGFRRYARALGIEWLTGWDDGNRVVWELIPDEIEVGLRQAEKIARLRTSSRAVPAKHKYLLVLGRDRKETLRLNLEFEQWNPELVGLEYPKR